MVARVIGKSNKMGATLKVIATSVTEGIVVLLWQIFSQTAVQDVWYMQLHAKDLLRVTGRGRVERIFTGPLRSPGRAAGWAVAFWAAASTMAGNIRNILQAWIPWAWIHVFCG